MTLEITLVGCFSFLTLFSFGLFYLLQAMNQCRIYDIAVEPEQKPFQNHLIFSSVLLYNILLLAPSHNHF